MTVEQIIIALVIGVISFFLKDIFNRFMKLSEKVDNGVSMNAGEMARVKERVEVLESKVPSEIANLEKLMELQFKQFSEQITELKRAIVHAENTMKQQGDAYIKLFENMTK